MVTCSLEHILARPHSTTCLSHNTLVILLKQHRVVMLLVGTRQLVHLISRRLREALTITIASRLSSSKPLVGAQHLQIIPVMVMASHQLLAIVNKVILRMATVDMHPAPQTGYGQPQSTPVQGYDQQQGYTSTPGYGNVTNPTSEGQTHSYGGAQADTTQAPPPVQSQQGYNTTQPPNTNPASYPTQGSTQPGYGVPTSQSGYGTQPASGYGPNYGPPQAQKPPAGQAAYGQQPQQSPGAQGGYVQSGYPQSQPPPAAQAGGYAQPDSGAQRAPPSGYGASAAQPGYGAPPYGAPPVTQPGYGQQQLPYNSSYGGGYSQPPAYAADGAPTSQAVQPGGVAKASPKS
ncbi:hypothetical protein HYC85_021711 [Camellia sinensis]|uniref:Uncharacterized protein n=1 Tax=Camellia sinensis TaxID=4442 RepID=A0A7J7GMA0_CAMSI|nr:hypothetical protein HYC85_021711 [Camellia sinensis]